MKKLKKKTQKIVLTKDGIIVDEIVNNPFDVETKSKTIEYEKLPRSFPPLLLKSIKPNISDKNVLESLTLIVYKDEKNKKSKIVTKSAKENKNKTFILNGIDIKFDSYILSVTPYESIKDREEIANIKLEEGCFIKDYHIIFMSDNDNSNYIRVLLNELTK